MKQILRIDAAPGFEDSVEDALRGTRGVFSVVPEKEKNFDFVVGLEGQDANQVRDIENELHHESGVQGIERVESPDDKLLERLRPE